jgi:AbrB family looped-hinge helix DNA binding protein
MIKVRVSPKYQVVIPEVIRQNLQILPGEQLQVFPYENRIEMIPIKHIKKMRGFLKGIDTTVEREKDRI